MCFIVFYLFFFVFCFNVHKRVGVVICLFVCLNQSYHWFMEFFVSILFRTNHISMHIHLFFHFIRLSSLKSKHTDNFFFLKNFSTKKKFFSWNPTMFFCCCCCREFASSVCPSSLMIGSMMMVHYPPWSVSVAFSYYTPVYYYYRWIKFQHSFSLFSFFFFWWSF